MAAVDLRFEQPAGGNDLLFGWTDAPSATEAILQATLPGLVFAALAIPYANVTLAATLPDLAMSAAGQYQSHAARPTVGQRRTAWQWGNPSIDGSQDRFGSTEPERQPFSPDWQQGQGQSTAAASSWDGILPRLPHANRIRYQDAQRLSPGDRQTGYAEAIRYRTVRASAYQAAQRAGWLRWAAFHQDGWRDRRFTTTSRFQQAGHLPGLSRQELSQNGLAWRVWWDTWFQDAIVPPPGIHRRPPIPPRSPCYVPWPHLLFALQPATGANLLFICEGIPWPHETIIVPLRRVYFVSNDFSLVRLADGYPLPAASLTLATDADSWCWSMSGALASLSALDAIAITEDGPVTVRAHINGVNWDFIVDDPEGDEEWNVSAATIHGRSTTALFDEPYYPALNYGNTEERTFEQLANDLFVYNGVPMGVTIDSSLDDWLIPAGTWSFPGTPVAGLKRLAEAPAAILSSAKTGQGFILEPRYPVLPWDWASATPWASIPRGYWIGHSHRRQTKPVYDLVIVGGDTGNGILAPVQRTGSSGSWPAPQALDRLITHTTAARQRGAAILADTGRQSMETISMPIGENLGLVPLNALLELEDTVTWRGLVRSVSVSVQLQGRTLDILQTLEVERHYG